MGKKNPISTSFNLPDGREVIIETGKLATQADGSVVVKIGSTMIFASVVSAKEMKEGMPYFPLFVDYQEKFAAAGRIPGNFFKREARLNDYEILTSRLVDRAIRPLFPDGYMNETQVAINLISGDKEELPDAYAALATSAALTISDIPFAGPISEVRVAKIKGEYVVNPQRTALSEAELDIIVAANAENVVMVEGEGKEIQENDLVEAIKVGHEAIKVQCTAQLDLAEKLGGVTKREVQELPENEDLKKEIEKLAKDKLYKVSKSFSEKHVRKNGFSEIYDEVLNAITEKESEEFVEENSSIIERYFGKLKKEVIREMVLSDDVRLDGRKPDEIRPIWTEIDYLPAAHGSAIFNRGETQALASLTLGTKLDELMMDTALNQYYDKFILHYNFPAFSVGEIKPNRGPGRREVGHANLAARSLRQVFPEHNPYTMRIVSDIMESNGSSSMATVCAGSLALMDAGIKIKSAVSGIAMGMISDGKKTAILSDILGDEDAIGDMDFKVTGTEKGITGCQMDIKIEGLSYEVLENALQQAKEGRLHILNEMSKSISDPREDLKPHAPRIVEVKIGKSFIGGVIGPGGANIRELQELTGTVITIEEVDNMGIVNISSSNKEGIDKAIEKINEITYVPEVGEVFQSVVKSVMNFGVFVEFKGKSGLLPVSEISHTYIKDVSEVFSVGDEVKVKLIEIDRRTGKYRLSRKALIDNPNGDNDRSSGRDRGRYDRRDRRGSDRRGNDRRGGRRDNRDRDDRRR